MGKLGLACLLLIGCSDGGGAPGSHPPDPNGVAAEAVIQIGGGPFTDLAINPDGMRMCIAGSEFGFYGLDGKCLPDGPPSVVPVKCIAARHYFYSLDQQLLVYNEQWDMLGAATVTDPMRGEIPSLRAAASADGATLAVAGYLPDDPMADPNVGKTWVTQINVGAVGGAAQGKPLTSFAGAPNNFAISPDGRIAVVPIGGKLVGFDVASATEVQLPQLPQQPLELSWPAGGGLLVLNADGLHELAPPASATRLADVSGPRPTRGRMVRTLEGGYLVAAPGNNQPVLAVLDVHTPPASWRDVARLPEYVVAIDITPDRSKLYVLLPDKVLVYDVRALVTAPALAN